MLAGRQRALACNQYLGLACTRNQQRAVQCLPRTRPLPYRHSSLALHPCLPLPRLLPPVGPHAHVSGTREYAPLSRLTTTHPTCLVSPAAPGSMFAPPLAPGSRPGQGLVGVWRAQGHGQGKGKGLGGQGGASGTTNLPFSLDLCDVRGRSVELWLVPVVRMHQGQRQGQQQQQEHGRLDQQGVWGAGGVGGEHGRQLRGEGRERQRVGGMGREGRDGDGQEGVRAAGRGLGERVFGALWGSGRSGWVSEGSVSDGGAQAAAAVAAATAGAALVQTGNGGSGGGAGGGGGRAGASVGVGGGGGGGSLVGGLAVDLATSRALVAGRGKKRVCVVGGKGRGVERTGRGGSASSESCELQVGGGVHVRAGVRM